MLLFSRVDRHRLAAGPDRLDQLDEVFDQRAAEHALPGERARRSARAGVDHQGGDRFATSCASLRKVAVGSAVDGSMPAFRNGTGGRRPPAGSSSPRGRPTGLDGPGSSGRARSSASPKARTKPSLPVRMARTSRAGSQAR